MLPTKYTPKHEVVTYDNEIYFIDSDKMLAMKTEMETAKFIRIGDTLLATSSIKTVRPAKMEISMLEQMLVWKNESVKSAVREKVREREKENMLINEAVILNIISKYDL